MLNKSHRRSLRLVLSLLSLLLMPLANLSASSAAGLPTVRAIAPEFNSANDTFAADGLGQWYAAGGRSFFKYVGAGSTITITYLVTSDGTAPWVDKTINFMVNAPYSGSKASWEVNGTAVGASKDAANGYGFLVTGKTNAEGKVTFTIKNTDTAASAEPIPTSETQARLTTGRLYGNMKAVVDGLNDMQQAIDLLTFDITKAEPVTLPGASTTPSASPTPKPSATATPSVTPTATPVVTQSASPTPTATPKVTPTKAAAKKSTITCVKGKTTKKVTAVKPKCPSGYTKKK
jgi:hypothetical protein